MVSSCSRLHSACYPSLFAHGLPGPAFNLQSQHSLSNVTSQTLLACFLQPWLGPHSAMAARSPPQPLKVFHFASDRPLHRRLRHWELQVLALLLHVPHQVLQGPPHSSRNSVVTTSCVKPHLPGPLPL